MTLLEIEPHRTVDAGLDAIAARPIFHFEALPVNHDSGRVLIYSDDGGYATGTVDSDGPRHRVWLNDGNYVYEDISRTDSTQTIIEKVLYRNIQALTDMKQRLNVVELNRAVEAIEAANVLIFCCMGSSGLAAEEGVMRFTRAGKKCILFRDQSIQLMTAAIVGPQDAVIGISNSGHSTLVVESLKLAQSNGARTIGITSSEESPLVKYSDISLFTPTKSSALGPGLSWEATTSKSAQILVIDVLYACFAARHFDETLKSLEDTYTAIKDTRG